MPFFSMISTAKIVGVFQRYIKSVVLGLTFCLLLVIRLRNAWRSLRSLFGLIINLLIMLFLFTTLQLSLPRDDI